VVPSLPGFQSVLLTYHTDAACPFNLCFLDFIPVTFDCSAGLGAPAGQYATVLTPAIIISSYTGPKILFSTHLQAHQYSVFFPHVNTPNVTPEKMYTSIFVLRYGMGA
jgi:hypothetical protein